MKNILIAVAIAILPPPDPAELAEAMVVITGASSIEELDEYETERFERLAEHPAEINISTGKQLISTGLFSRYQVASILDYRSRCGDILSIAELALLDGFNSRYADALRHFTSFTPTGGPGMTRGGSEAGLMVKASARRREGGTAESAGGFKFHAGIRERVEFNWSRRTSYSEREPGPGNMNMTLSARDGISRLIIGDYAARFGQGLAAWNGFSMSGYTSIQAFRRNGSGLSPTSSFTPMNKGIALSTGLGKWDFSAAASLPFREGSLVNVTRTGRTSSCGLTLTPSAAAADFSVGHSGISVFGEGAYTVGKGVSAISGVIFSPSYGNRYAMLGRLNVKGESGVAAGLQRKWADVCLDCLAKPEKSVFQWKAVCNLKDSRKWSGLEIKPELKLGWRQKRQQGCNPSHRAEIRADLGLGWKDLSAKARFDLVNSVSTSWLAYTEAGSASSGGKCSWHAYLRWTLFKIDHWDDRIYCYERDAPGSFNVPAYYGRGWAASAVAGIRMMRHAFYARISYVEYPWTLPAKPASAEIRVQYKLDLRLRTAADRQRRQESKREDVARGAGSLG